MLQSIHSWGQENTRPMPVYLFSKLLYSLTTASRSARPTAARTGASLCKRIFALVFYPAIIMKILAIMFCGFTRPVQFQFIFKELGISKLRQLKRTNVVLVTNFRDFCEHFAMTDLFFKDLTRKV